MDIFYCGKILENLWKIRGKRIFLLKYFTIFVIVILVKRKQVFSMSTMKHYRNMLFDDYQKLELKNAELSKENRYLKYENDLLERKYNTLMNKYKCLKENIIDNEKQKYQKQIDEKDKEIERLKSLLNNDGTNSGLPTSKTPINKTKLYLIVERKAIKI